MLHYVHFYILQVCYYSGGVADTYQRHGRMHTLQAILFADSKTLCRTIIEGEDSCQLQNDLKSLEEKEQTWEISFNPAKCYTITEARKRSPQITPYILKEEELGTNKTANHLCTKFQI